MLQHYPKTIYWCNNTFNDRWLIDAFEGKRDGYYIELGAGNGIWDSSTYVLERYYGWKGISIEPNKTYYRALKSHRNNICIQAAICGEDGTDDYIVPANECDWELSGLVRNVIDKSRCYAEGYKIEKVKTLSFPTLLEAFECPEDIDLISMDIEGSELETLLRFPFHKYRVQCFIVKMTNPVIADLLLGNGYERVENKYTRETREGYFWYG